jgi:predicted metalloprotease with PDZ domain
MHAGWKLTGVAALAIAGLAVDGLAFADGTPEIKTEEKIVVRTDDGNVHVLVSGDDEAVWVASGEEGPFEVVTFGEDGAGGAYLGVSTREETKLSEGGARITRIFPDTPAQKAGLEEGDVIVAANGKPVRGPAMLTETIHAAKPGDRIAFEVVRDGNRKTVNAELAERKGMRIVMPRFGSKGWDALSPEERARMESEIGRARDEARKAIENLRIEIPRFEGDARTLHWEALALASGRPKLGVELVDTTPELREHLGGREDAGVLVGKVLEGSSAEKAGVKVGDLLFSIDGDSVGTPGDVIRAVGRNAGKTVTIEVVRDGRVQRLTATLPEDEGEGAVRPRARLVAPQAPPAPSAPVAAPAPPAPAAVPARMLERRVV